MNRRHAMRSGRHYPAFPDELRDRFGGGLPERRRPLAEQRPHRTLDRGMRDARESR